jgi:hypothetical protein
MEDRMVSDLAAFLLARYAEEEKDAQVARKAPRWVMESDLPDTWSPTRDHIIRYSPARVLADIAAKRRVVELHREVWHTHWADVRETACATCTRGPLESGDTWPCPTLLALAQPYAEHPDWREEWVL